MFKLNTVLRVAVGVIVAVGLSGCTKLGFGDHSDQYQQAKTLTPISAPKGTAAVKGKNYYPVPAARAKSAGHKQPSLVPPGSKINQYRAAKEKPKAAKSSQATKKSTSASTAKTVRTAKLLDDGQRLDLAMSSKKAWKAVGAALKQTDYRVLDQDSGMGTYYVLDTQVTRHHITKKTPIYRLQVKAEKSGHSDVTVFDQYNKPAPADVSEAILAVVYQRLGQA